MKPIRWIDVKVSTSVSDNDDQQPYKLKISGTSWDKVSRGNIVYQQRVFRVTVNIDLDSKVYSYDGVEVSLAPVYVDPNKLNTRMLHNDYVGTRLGGGTTGFLFIYSPVFQTSLPEFEMTAPIKKIRARLTIKQSDENERAMKLASGATLSMGDAEVYKQDITKYLFDNFLTYDGIYLVNNKTNQGDVYDDVMDEYGIDDVKRPTIYKDLFKPSVQARGFYSGSYPLARSAWSDDQTWDKNNLMEIG
jgi:hypothetical protein